LTRLEIAIDLLASTRLVPMVKPDDNPLTLSLSGAQTTTVGYSKPADANRRLLHATLPLELLDRMAAGTSELTITAGKKAVTIPAPALAAATAALRSCHSGWLRGLGVDPLTWATGRRPTLVNPGRWITADDYPRDGIGIPYAKATVLLRIDAQGRITSCETVAAAAPTFGKATCQAVMQRGSAKPASDPAGNPIAGATFMTTTWTSS
jgi:hypothetical protein